MSKETLEQPQGFAMRWVAVSAVAGAAMTFLGIASFGRIYAGLPERTTKNEEEIRQIKTEQREQAIGQGRIEANQARMDAKLDIMLELHQRQMKANP